MMQELQYVDSRKVTRPSLYPVTEIQLSPAMFANIDLSASYLMKNLKIWCSEWNGLHEEGGYLFLHKWSP